MSHRVPGRLSRVVLRYRRLVQPQSRCKTAPRCISSPMHERSVLKTQAICQSTAPLLDSSSGAGCLLYSPTCLLACSMSLLRIWMDQCRVEPLLLPRPPLPQHCAWFDFCEFRCFLRFAGPTVFQSTSSSPSTSSSVELAASPERFQKRSKTVARPTASSSASADSQR